MGLVLSSFIWSFAPKRRSETVRVPEKFKDKDRKPYGFTAEITLKSGRVIGAKGYSLRAFLIYSQATNTAVGIVSRRAFFSKHDIFYLTMLNQSSIMVSMNRLSTKQRARVLAALVEGNSIRATVRMTGVAKNTVAKLLVDVGRACAEFQDEALRDLTCKRIQCDEIWSFCYAKQKNVPEALRGEFGYGDVWTWVGMDADTKLVVSWLVGLRDARYASAFIEDLASRLSSRVQLTTDGLKAYLEAVEGAFGCDIDYAQLVKMYGEPKGEKTSEHKYSPPNCTGARREKINGNPDQRHISTSYIERQNLTMRMSMRRFTRLTNGFSKKVENLEAAVALHFMYYNFCRIHRTLRVTPAMEAGVTDKLWSLEDVAELLVKDERKSN